MLISSLPKFAGSEKDNSAFGYNGEITHDDVEFAPPRKRQADVEIEETGRPGKKRKLDSRSESTPPREAIHALHALGLLPPPESPQSIRSGSKRGDDISGVLSLPAGATASASPDVDAPAHETHLRADADDADSTYGDAASTTMSIPSSIFDFPIICGRTYDAYGGRGVYLSPNDKDQQEVMDMGHELHLRISGRKLYSAPIAANPQRILDVGTGTGLWALDVAEEYESAEVEGIDLSPIQPEFVPPNCKFTIDDFNETWESGDNWDLIHIRDMNGAVKKWPEKYETIMQHLKPGGWVEQAEFSRKVMSDDGTLPANSALSRCWPICREIGEKIGQSFEAGETACASITAAGFTNVNEYKIRVPIGPWAKDEPYKDWGQWCQWFLLEGLDGFFRRGLIDVLGWSVEDAETYMSQLRKEYTDPKIHSYMIMVYGQKPEVSRG